MIYEQPITEFDALSMAIAKNLIGYSGEASNRFDARLIPFPGRMVVTWSAAKVNNIVVGMAWCGQIWGSDRCDTETENEAPSSSWTKPLNAHLTATDWLTV